MPHIKHMPPDCAMTSAPLTVRVYQNGIHKKTLDLQGWAYADPMTGEYADAVVYEDTLFTFRPHDPYDITCRYGSIDLNEHKDALYQLNLEASGGRP